MAEEVLGGRMSDYKICMLMPKNKHQHIFFTLGEFD
jgi:hypothetical protein